MKCFVFEFHFSFKIDLQLSFVFGFHLGFKIDLQFNSMFDFLLEFAELFNCQMINFGNFDFDFMKIFMNLPG